MVWLFVNRNFAWQRKRSGKAFKEKDIPADMEALRTHDRFGISSWPQMIVFDPRDNKVLEKPPRTLKGLTACSISCRRTGTCKPLLHSFARYAAPGGRLCIIPPVSWDVSAVQSIGQVESTDPLPTCPRFS